MDLFSSAADHAEAWSGTRAGGRVVASPYARRLAAEAGVDVGQAQGTGPGGRIVAADVQKLIESGGGKGAPAQQASAGADAGKPHAAGPAAEVRTPGERCAGAALGGAGST